MALTYSRKNYKQEHNPDLTYGQLRQTSFTQAAEPHQFTTSTPTDIISIDKNRFYYAPMNLYGEPAAHIQLP